MTTLRNIELPLCPLLVGYLPNQCAVALEGRRGSLGAAPRAPRSRLDRGVLGAILRGVKAGEPFTPREVSARLGVKVPSVAWALARLRELGRATTPRYGQWVILPGSGAQ